MNGSGNLSIHARFEHLVSAVAVSVMATLIASCDVSSKIPTHDTNPSSPYACRRAGPQASPQIRLPRQSIQAREHSEASQFWEEIEQQGTPLVEQIPGDPQHSLVTFLWRAVDDSRNVAVVGGVINGAEPAKNQMARVEGSDVWYLSFAIRNDARFTYAFSPNDSMLPLPDPARVSMDFKLDPLNPRRCLGHSGKYSSYIEQPNAPYDPWTTTDHSMNLGNLYRTRFQSRLLGNQRVLWTCFPASCDPKYRGYPLPILLDCGAYTHPIASASAILDHLIATNKIPPILAILVGNTQRASELPSSMFAAFLATELVPWATERFGASQDPDGIVVAGSSLGGLAASHAGFQYPDVLGNVLSMSGSYWWKWDHQQEPESLIRRFEETPRKSIRFFVAVGAMEKADSQLATNRRFANVLAEKGYSVEYQ